MPPNPCELVSLFKKVTKEIRDDNDLVEKLQDRIEQRLSVRTKILDQMMKLVVSEKTDCLTVGKTSISLVEDIDVKIDDLAALSPGFYSEERSVTRYPNFRKIKRHLLAGKPMPGAHLEKRMRLVVRTRR